MVMLLLVSSATSVYADTNTVKVNTADATVEIKVSSAGYSSFKAIVEKDDVEYIYNLVSANETLPLQMGSGKYKISVLGSNDGRRYKLLSDKTINVTIDEEVVFLNATQTVNWNEESQVAILAKELTKDAVTDQEKLEIIHEYVITNVRYDYQKAASLPKGYIPLADDTLAEGTGICYDFAAMMASMLRSVDVPAKLVKGYSSYTPVYHAWNEVLIDGEWVVVDASTDSIYVDYNVAYTLVKADSAYVGSKVY
ncbi:transglutaminase family protein [Acidaminobacter sp. JC074]|uniref:transglutaminase-like domain-containing protein n=1 Tax=Acidaminobacter sp. JC074 TaxID=2530199 RepID=UPI001F1029DD|nr:transglutaminase-like domain-containing protein [Acidaminobacter sp. JC074]